MNATMRTSAWGLGGWAARLVCAAVLGGVFGGCAESVETYTRFGGWSRSPDRAVVFSGDPCRDATALGATGKVMTEHDWEVLEKIAPRPIWERLAAARELLSGEEVRGPATRPADCNLDPAVGGAQLERDVPTLTLPDGRIQMYYRLRHYGGVGVTASYDGGTDRRKVARTPPKLEPLLALLAGQLGDKGTVAPLPEENTLVITCDPAVKASVLSMLAGIDVPPRQVEITAKIFEIKHDFDFQIGARTLLEHIGSEGSQSVLGTFNPVDFLGALSTGADFQGGVVQLLHVFDAAGLTVDTTLRLLADTGLIKMVASPRMTVTVGKTAYILAGQELPIQSARIANDQIISEKVTYRPIGVQLYITPQVVGPDSVKLHVVTSVSAISGFTDLDTMTQDQGGQTFVNPVLDSREAETQVTVDNEATLVMGGLRMVRTITRERKMPGLGDIPLLEWFFKSHRSQNHVNDLYFFVTPRLVKKNKPS